MYNANKAPKHVSIESGNRESFRLPHLVTRLLRNLLSSENKTDLQVQKKLAIFYNNAKYDPALLEVYHSLGWVEESKSFDREVRFEDVQKKLEEVYEFKLEDFVEQEKSNESRNAAGKEGVVGNVSSQITQSPVIENNNSNLSFFNSNKNDSSMDPFSVFRPIPLSNSQGDRNLNFLNNYDGHLQLDQFLTNSAKAWNNAAEDESSLVSNWQRTSSGKFPNKTPSFHHEDMNPSSNANPILIEENSEVKNSRSSSNVAVPQPISKRNLSYKGIMDQIGSSSNSSFKFPHYNMPYYNQGYPGVVQNNPSSFQPPIQSNYTFLNNSGSYPINYPPHMNISNFNADKKVSARLMNKRKDSLGITNPPLHYSYFEEEETSRQKVKTKKNTRKVKVILKKKVKKGKVTNNGKVNAKIGKLGKLAKLKINKVIQVHPQYNNNKAALNNNSSIIRSSNFGLKEISKKVKDIVRRYKKTSYKQISDIIVSEINEKDIKDEKNIRRRIYDSLNVMKAMNLFKKDQSNKFILWNGTSFDDRENISEEDEEDYTNNNRNRNSIKSKIKREEDFEYINQLRRELDIRREGLYKKSVSSNVLYEQQQILSELIKRNAEEKANIKEEEKIKFPFIIIEFPENRNLSNNIIITTNETKSKLHFSLDTPVNIYGDMDAIKKINTKLSSGYVYPNHKGSI